jgi:hypothetical protein
MSGISGITNEIDNLYAFDEHIPIDSQQGMCFVSQHAVNTSECDRNSITRSRQTPSKQSRSTTD